jgi:hypothetical protein
MKASDKRNIDCYELRQLKPWFYEESSKLLDQRKKAKFQQLQ